MGHWNLRWVRDLERRELAFHIREVFYDDKGYPWGYGDARWRDVLRWPWDWLRSFGDGIEWPADFVGKGPDVNAEAKPFDLDRMWDEEEDGEEDDTN